MIFQFKVIAGIAAAGVVLLIVAVFSHRAATKNDELMYWVNHTHVVLENLGQWQSDVSGAETNQRGYLLTGASAYLTDYHQHVAQLQEGLARIRQLTSDNPHQLAALDRLAPMLQGKLAIWDERIDLRTQLGLEPAATSVQIGRGKELTVGIYATLSQMVAEEKRLLDLRSQELEASSRRIRSIIVIGDGLGFLFLALAGLVIHQEMRRRAAAEAVVRTLNAELELKVAQRTAELADRAKDLERSNTELQQFAYVASHDLQEPLRTISSFTQLLAKRYREKLDDKAREFIDFAVDGCKRMQAQINDLLAFSRVGTQAKPSLPVSCDVVVDRVLKTLKVSIDESKAVISRDSLPVVLADEIQLGQLFQNLIGNAIKFRTANTPKIHISAVQDPVGWKISVRDNGIGIAPEHGDRVFVIFQRLHTKSEYPGTGIGLAICKKIAERHGGRIWFEPAPVGGTTFCFTIHAAQSSFAEETKPSELRAAASAH
jgi:signal transduction histidine kinase